ncbi:diguanylate cyclase (GGDEF) domain-containing protein [Natronincola peptidivorans]|uniref:Diguanylate cyclase (GGDEF) domain-containing protein n=1 Tax=Natronincola peptidivorans TaxID=426128 RepID=A0A1I0EK90_9FIRM|nr:GGDEF domain-containing protein [Natronincola peptidivorans]SET45370.1 diguanylate cyclase (GGDEF) domain-containing protein [Natronincola peptidivorans]
MNIYGFNILSSYLVVEEMMRGLRVPPFDEEVDPIIKKLWQEYYLVISSIAIILLLIISIGAFKIYAGRVINEKNRELEKVVEKLKDAYQEIEKLSMKDSLSNIYNRRYFDKVFPEKFNLAKRSKTIISLLVIDIDRFKEINDLYGHLVGDEIIKVVGQTIDMSLYRAIDFVVRYGGDEFVVFLHDTTEEGALLASNRILSAIRAIKLNSNNEKDDIKITLSIGGVVAIPSKETSVSELFKLADDAMYEAKKQGKNRVKLVKI